MKTLTLSSLRMGTRLTLGSEQIEYLGRFVRVIVRTLTGEIVINGVKPCPSAGDMQQDTRLVPRRIDAPLTLLRFSASVSHLKRASATHRACDPLARASRVVKQIPSSSASSPQSVAARNLRMEGTSLAIFVFLRPTPFTRPTRWLQSPTLAQSTQRRQPLGQFLLLRDEALPLLPMGC
jgi:hypothetical protein